MPPNHLEVSLVKAARFAHRLVRYALWYIICVPSIDPVNVTERASTGSNECTVAPITARFAVPSGSDLTPWGDILTPCFAFPVSTSCDEAAMLKFSEAWRTVPTWRSGPDLGSAAGACDTEAVFPSVWMVRLGCPKAWTTTPQRA